MTSRDERIKKATTIVQEEKLSGAAYVLTINAMDLRTPPPAFPSVHHLVRDYPVEIAPYGRAAYLGRIVGLAPGDNGGMMLHIAKTQPAAEDEPANLVVPVSSLVVDAVVNGAVLNGIDNAVFAIAEDGIIQAAMIYVEVE